MVYFGIPFHPLWYVVARFQRTSTTLTGEVCARMHLVGIRCRSSRHHHPRSGGVVRLHATKKHCSVLALCAVCACCAVFLLVII